MSIFLRFIFGAVLAGAVVLLGGIPLTAGARLVLVVGTLAAAWGDKFLLGVMSVMRYLR